MSDKTKDWRMIHLKLYDKIEEEKPFCLALFKFFSLEFNKTEKIIYYRKLDNTKSYYSWKIINFVKLDKQEDDNKSTEKI